MSATRRLLTFGGLLLLLVGLAACGRSESRDVVARVGSDPIDARNVDHWTSVLAGDGATAPRSSPLRQRTLSFLISSQWLLGEAKALKVNASDKEAQAQLNLLHYDRLEHIPYEGLPKEGDVPALFARAHAHADRLWLMKLAILTAKVNQKHLEQAEREITPGAIATYYKAHKPQFVLPERRDITWIVVYSERTFQKAMREVRSGKSLLSVATRLSLDPPTLSGVVLRTAPEKEFAKRIFAARPHVLEGPFRQGQNHYALEVTHVTPAYQQTLEQAQASIRRQLATQAVATSVRADFERRWASRTSCRFGYVVRQCRQDAALAA